MQPCHNLRRTLGPGQINFVTESPQQALTDLLNPNYCLELRQSFDLDINLCKTDASLLASTIYMGLQISASAWSCRDDLARDESATLGHGVTEPGESGQVRVKGYLHFTGDGRLCHDYVTSPVTMSHLSRVSGPRGAHHGVVITHSAHDTDDTVLNSCQPPVIFIDSRALHKHI